MKKGAHFLIILFFLAICSFFVMRHFGKTVTTHTQESKANSVFWEEQRPQSSTSTADDDIAFCKAPASFNSTQALVSSLKAGTCQMLDGTTYSLQSIKEKVDSVYLPASIPHGFHLYHIELDQYGIVYYYMPAEEINRPYFNYKTGIVFIHSIEVGNASDPLLATEKQMSTCRDQDGYIYVPSLNSIFFAIGNTRMSVRVPDSMNRYDTLKSLCVTDRVSIYAEVE